jgi:hypothetical protein
MRQKLPKTEGFATVVQEVVKTEQLCAVDVTHVPWPFCCYQGHY